MNLTMPMSVEEVLKEAGLPPSTPLIGYVVRFMPQNEYLHRYDNLEDSLRIYWSKTPDKAKCYGSREAAKKDMQLLDKPGTMLGLLFDLGSQLFVVSLAEDA